MESVVNVLIFYAIYILHLKHVLDLLQYYQMNFLLKEKFIKVVHYLSNLFINDILNNCEKYGVSIGRKKKKKKKKNLKKLLKKKKRYINGLILNEINF